MIAPPAAKKEGVVKAPEKETLTMGEPEEGSTESTGRDRWGIPNFTPALEAALRPYADLETTWDFDEFLTQVAKKFTKSVNKYWSDERMMTRGNASQGRAVVEEFVEHIVGSINSACYDKAWFGKVDFTGPLAAAAVHVFKGQKAFARTLNPLIEKYVQEALFRYMEEERQQKCIWDAVEHSGVKEAYRKKARSHLALAYDEAHMKAPWGTLEGESLEMRMLQEFVKGWITCFIRRAWDIMQNGIGNDKDEVQRDQQVLFITVLFQALTNADNACLPHDLTSIIESPPPTPWPFIAEAAEAVFAEMDAYAAEKELAGETEPPAKWAKTGKKGAGKGLDA